MRISSEDIYHKLSKIRNTISLMKHVHTVVLYISQRPLIYSQRFADQTLSTGCSPAYLNLSDTLSENLREIIWEV